MKRNRRVGMRLLGVLLGGAGVMIVIQTVSLFALYVLLALLAVSLAILMIMK